MGQPIQPYGTSGSGTDGSNLQIDRILIVDQNTADSSAYLSNLYNLFRGYGNNETRIKQVSTIYCRIESFKVREEGEITKLDTEIKELDALIAKTNNPGREDLKLLFTSITAKYQDCLAKGVSINDLLNELDKVRTNLTKKRADKENELKERKRRINIYNDGMSYTANALHLLQTQSSLPVPAGATVEKPTEPSPSGKLTSAKTGFFKPAPAKKPAGLAGEFIDEIEKGNAKITAPNFWYNEKTKIAYTLKQSGEYFIIRKFKYEGAKKWGKLEFFKYKDDDGVLAKLYTPESLITAAPSPGTSTKPAEKTASISAEFTSRLNNNQLRQIDDLDAKTKVWTGTFNGYEVRYELQKDGTLTKYRKPDGTGQGYTVMGTTRGGKLAKAYAAAPMVYGGLISYDGGKSWSGGSGASGTEIAAVGPPRRPAKGYKTIAAVPMGELTQWKYDPIKERYRNVDELASEETDTLRQLRGMGFAYDGGTISHGLNIYEQYARAMKFCAGSRKPVKLPMFFERGRIVELSKEGKKLIVTLTDKDGAVIETIQYAPEALKEPQGKECITREHNRAAANISTWERVLFSGAPQASNIERTEKWDAVAKQWYDARSAYAPSQESAFKEQSQGWLRHIGFNPATGLISRANPYEELNRLELAFNSRMPKMYLSAAENIFLELKENKNGGITVTKYKGEAILETIEYAKKTFDGRLYITKKHSAAGKVALLEDKRISCAPDGTDMTDEKTETAMAEYYYKGRSGLDTAGKICADYNKFLYMYKNGIDRISLTQGNYITIAAQGGKVVVSRLRSSDSKLIETAVFTAEAADEKTFIAKTTTIAGGVTTERISYSDTGQDAKMALLEEKPKSEKPKPVISAKEALRKECDILLTAEEGKEINLPEKTITIKNRIYKDQDNNRIEVYGVEISKKDGSKTKVMYDMVYDEEKKAYKITKIYYTDSVKKPSKTEKFFSDGTMIE